MVTSRPQGSRPICWLPAIYCGSTWIPGSGRSSHAARAPWHATDLGSAAREKRRFLQLLANLIVMSPIVTLPLHRVGHQLRRLKLAGVSAGVGEDQQPLPLGVVNHVLQHVHVGHVDSRTSRMAAEPPTHFLPRAQRQLLNCRAASKSATTNSRPGGWSPQRNAAESSGGRPAIPAEVDRGETPSSSSSSSWLMIWSTSDAVATMRLVEGPNTLPPSASCRPPAAW